MYARPRNALKRCFRCRCSDLVTAVCRHLVLHLFNHDPIKVKPILMSIFKLDLTGMHPGLSSVLIHPFLALGS